MQINKLHETGRARQDEDSLPLQKPQQQQKEREESQVDKPMEKAPQAKENVATVSTPTNTNLEDDPSNSALSCVAKTSKPSRKRYTRAQLMDLNNNMNLKEPPAGYNPAVLKQTTEGGKEIPPREGVKWTRTSSGSNWAGGRGNQGGKGNVPYGRFGEGTEEMPGGQNPRGGHQLRSAISWNEERLNSGRAGGGGAGAGGGTGGGGNGGGSGAINIPTGGGVGGGTLTGPASQDRLTRRGSRSEAPGRWDNNKDELSRSLEKRPSQGPERWPSYGHRDHKEKHQKGVRDEMEEVDTLVPQAPAPPPPPPQVSPPQSHQHPSFHDHQEPEWMHHRETKNSERAEQHRKIAADFEQKRKQMREVFQKERKDGSGGVGSRNGGEHSQYMTDEEINSYKKELEDEERGTTSGVFTFDSLKEALKLQGVSNLPPMPTTGISTVDQIEKSMKASGPPPVSQPSVADIERQKFELLKAAGSGTTSMQNSQYGPLSVNNGGNNAASGVVAGGGNASNFEGANLLLSMLRGQNRPPNTPNTGPTGNAPPPFMHPNQVSQQQQQQQQHMGFPTSVQQQQQMLSGSGTALERLFAGNQRAAQAIAGLPPNVGNHLGLTFGNQPTPSPQQQHQMGLAQVAGLRPVNIPYMQHAGQQQFNPRAVAAHPQNHLLTALIANHAQRQKQEQMLAQLKLAQQETALQHSKKQQQQQQMGNVGDNDFAMNSSRSAPISGQEGEVDRDGDGSNPGLRPPTAGGPVPSVQPPMPLHSFGLAGQGGFVSSRPSMSGLSGVGMMNPSMMSGPLGVQQPGLFQGGNLGPGGAPLGVGPHPSLFMQNGGVMARPNAAPGLNPLAFPGMRPNSAVTHTGGGVGLGGMMDARQAQMPLMNLPPPNQGANLQNAMFGTHGTATNGLNRFFALNNLGASGHAAAAAAAAAGFTQGGELVQTVPDAANRGRSLEELKNEAQ